MARVSLEFYMVVIVACVSVLALLFLSFGGVKSSDLYGEAIASMDNRFMGLEDSQDRVIDINNYQTEEIDRVRFSSGTARVYSNNPVSTPNLELVQL